MILTTHHHQDHVEANLALKKRFGLKIVGPKAEADKIPGIDVELSEGSKLEFAGQPVQVIETPGHTAGHICYYLPKSHVAFVADTLFAMGCGKLLERPAPVMFHSLTKLVALPAGDRALLRPRIHADQRALRADHRPDQLGAEGTRGEGRKAARPGQADAADDARRGTLDQSVHPLARSGDPQESRHGEGERRRGLRRNPQAQGQLSRAT